MVFARVTEELFTSGPEFIERFIIAVVNRQGLPFS
jgi:hypothetical protein